MSRDRRWLAKKNRKFVPPLTTKSAKGSRTTATSMKASWNRSIPSAIARTDDRLGSTRRGIATRLRDIDRNSQYRVSLIPLERAGADHGRAQAETAGEDRQKWLPHGTRTSR